MSVNRLAAVSAGVLAATLLLSGPGLAQQAGPPDLDVDKDGAVSQQEFMADEGSRSVYGLLDSDSDGRIEPDEFDSISVYDRSHHDAWDMDKDGYLSEEEFVNGIYSAYDEDGDQNLDEQEMAEYADDAKRLWPQVEQDTNPPTPKD